MKKALQIYRRDVHRLLTNLIALVVIVGVCALPSLYAWFNIYANMDPYASTGSVKVAIANNDAGSGADSAIEMNAGVSIEENLKKNDQLGWQFVDEDTAIEGVKSGEYYAAIVIPSDFSESLISVLSGTVETPKLDYYVNEKKNAIAPKITSSGATSIQQTINETFSSVAAETISEIVESSVGEMDTDVNSLNEDLNGDITAIRENLDSYVTLIDEFESLSGEASSQLSSLSKTLDAVERAANSGSDTVLQGIALLTDTRTAISQFSIELSNGLSDSETSVNDLYIAASQKLGVLSGRGQSANLAIGESISSAQKLLDRNAELLSSLKELGNSVSDAELSARIDQELTRLQTQNETLQGVLDTLQSGNSELQGLLEDAASADSTLKNTVDENRQRLRDARGSLDKTLMPSLNSALDTASLLSGYLASGLDSVEPSAEQLRTVLTQLDDSLSDTSEALQGTRATLELLDGKLEGMQNDLTVLQSTQTYQELLSLEGLDEEGISQFMSSPVTINTEVLYDVENYGSSMTPFYTNLAIWVGGIILVNIIKLEVDEEESSGARDVSGFTVTEAYFGRWLLYITLGLIQAAIVCVGDILLLGVQCLYPGRFLLAGLVCAFVYVNLIFALSLTFKHIGKAVCVLLVILQIPGSAGTYPIEMTPVFFQKIHPLLPFTYGINAMREAIAGLYEHNYVRNLAILMIYVLLALFVGLILRLLMMNLNHLFDERLAETDLMICEENSPERGRPRITMAIEALMNDRKMRTEILERAAKFEKRYPGRIRNGFLTILILPLVFLVLAFSLEARLVFLILWILSIIAIAIYLIALEYFHSQMLRQLSMEGISEEDLMRMIREGKQG